MKTDQEKTLFEENVKRVSVLVTLPVGKAYTYTAPENLNLAQGDYVTVPVGRRKVLGVVWSDQADDNVATHKLKDIVQHHDCPPMSDKMQKFVDWVAKYTVSDRGSVLKMVLSQPQALEPPVPDMGYTLSPEVDVNALPEKRRMVAEFLMQNTSPQKAGTVAKATNLSPSVVQTMAKHGLVHQVEMLPHIPCQIEGGAVKPCDVTLSDGQQEAADRLVEMVGGQKFETALLDGVTGAGKTEVYFEAVAEAMRQGKQALVMLPEIALSTQFVERFEKRFGVKPALWHSDVPMGQKRQIWRGVASGQTKCVIGARSALFLPYTELGTIVVDEEHDASFKQEEGVIYNARDMAVMRAKLEQCPAVLVSATPSLETITNAKAGRYHHLKLPSRYGGAEMPDIHVIDMKQDKPERQMFLSPRLKDAIAQTLDADEQVMLFLNRRGYAPLTLCRTCGHRFECPSCTAWLVEHKKTGRLHCHHCGLSAPIPETCPECEDEGSLVACGPGVERIAEEIAETFPDAKPLILASDITNSHNLLAEAIGNIRNGNVNVIIGTQMIAKGHHFPQLTCVGVVDADLGLAGADLRAGERTYQLLHQVSGRAGRGEKPGHVYLQTYMADHPVLQALADGGRDRFLEAEAKERAEAKMPPYGRLAALVISGPDEGRVMQYCQQLARNAPRYDGVQILGPAPAALSILRGRHRMRFLIKTETGVAVQKMLSDWLAKVKSPNMVRIKIDIDPQSFL